ncbi:MAG: hypothetical protein AAGJ40_08780 [Planctomycetota bacterium]
MPKTRNQDGRPINEAQWSDRRGSAQCHGLSRWDFRGGFVKGRPAKFLMILLVAMWLPAMGQDGPSSDKVSRESALDRTTTQATVRAHLKSDQIANVFRSGSETTRPTPTDREARQDTESSDHSNNPVNATTNVNIEELIEQLGDETFAARERAAAALHALGDDAVASLRVVAEDSSRDPEVRIRAADVIQGVVGGQQAGRLDEFLRGGETNFEGWPIVREILGDNLRIRELFVELLMRHGDMLASLGGTSADRRQAWTNVSVRIQRGAFIERRPPTQTDAVALLLLANDPGVTLSASDEELLLSVLRKEAASILRRDPQLSGPFTALVGGWLLRSGEASREEIFWFALSWDRPEALALAKQSLRPGESTDVITLAIQTITRFGDASCIEPLKPFLNDARVVSDQQWVEGQIVQTQVNDVTAAAIILLSGKSLSDYGMNDNSLHPQLGFIASDVGLPTEDPAIRRDVLRSIEPLLSKASEKTSEDQDANENPPS